MLLAQVALSHVCRFRSKRHFAAEYARFLTAVHKGALWGKALGEFESQCTHTMERANDSKPSLTVDDYVNDNGLNVENFEFSGPTVFFGILLKPVKASADPAAAQIENSLVIVAQTKNEIIKEHNEMFRKNFIAYGVCRLHRRQAPSPAPCTV